MLRADRPALVFMNARGDHLINLPAVRALSEVFDGNLQLVCRPGYRETYFSDVDFCNVCQPKTSCANLQYSFDPTFVASELGPIDALFCLNPARSDSMDRLLTILAPSTSVGFDNMYRTSLPVDFTKHSADLAFDLVKSIDSGIQIEKFSSPPEISAQAAELAARVRQFLPANAKLLAVHADSKPNKMWPVARFRALLRTLLAQYSSLYVVDLGLRNWQLDTIANEGRVIWCGQAPMAAAIGLVGIADFFVGVDSCFLHAADLFRVPGIGLFGPTSPHEFGFRFGPHRHVRGKPSMHAIQVDSVLAEIESLNQDRQFLSSVPRRQGALLGATASIGRKRERY